MQVTYKFTEITYLQLFYARRARTRVNNEFVGVGRLSLTRWFERNAVTQRLEMLSHKKTKVLVIAHNENFVIFVCIV